MVAAMTDPAQAQNSTALLARYLRSAGIAFGFGPVAWQPLWIGPPRPKADSLGSLRHLRSWRRRPSRAADPHDPQARSQETPSALAERQAPARCPRTTTLTRPRDPLC